MLVKLVISCFVVHRRPVAWSRPSKARRAKFPMTIIQIRVKRHNPFACGCLFFTSLNSLNTRNLTEPPRCVGNDTLKNVYYKFFALQVGNLFSFKPLCDNHRYRELFRTPPRAKFLWPPVLRKSHAISINLLENFLAVFVYDPSP